MSKNSRSVCMKLPLVCCVCMLLKSYGIHADVHYSKFRIVFDDSHRKDTLIISNRDKKSINCNVSLADFAMGQSGPIKLVATSAEVNNSAKKLLRYAPRSSRIPPNGSQVIRISSRRRPGIAAGEYLSFIKVSCQEDEQTQKTVPNDAIQFKITPQIVSYFPLQVRVGDISASTHFENPRIIDVKGSYSLMVEQYRQGERSVVGDIQVKDQAGMVLGQTSNVVIYPPFTKREHSIKLKHSPKGELDVVFTENTSSLGSLVARIAVKL